MLGTEPRVSYMLSACSTSELYPQTWDFCLLKDCFCFVVCLILQVQEQKWLQADFVVQVFLFLSFGPLGVNFFSDIQQPGGSSTSSHNIFLGTRNFPEASEQFLSSSQVVIKEQGCRQKQIPGSTHRTHSLHAVTTTRSNNRKCWIDLGPLLTRSFPIPPSTVESVAGRDTKSSEDPRGLC